LDARKELSDRDGVIRVDEALRAVVVGGCIVALVGTIVGFYIYRRREEETRLNEHRYKALDQTSAQGW
jgi:hypothetical protein